MKKHLKESRMRYISLQTAERRKANWIGHFLRRNCILQHVIEGKTEEVMEFVDRASSYNFVNILRINCAQGWLYLQEMMKVKGRRGRRSKKLLDDIKEKIIYWRLKRKALDRTLWSISFGSGYGLWN